MKIFSKINIIGLVFLMCFFTSCEIETAEQDAAKTISPDGKPTVTLTTDFSGTAIEGETIAYTIVFSKPLERAVTFTPSIIGGTADSEDYEELSSVTMQPYTTEASFSIVLNSDYLIESTETLDIQLDILGIAEKYLVHPDTVIPVINISFDNASDPTLLTINFAWDNDLDMDMLTYSDTGAYPETLWGTGGAGSGNPEIDHSIWLADPTGDYYVTILDWWEGVDFNYTFTIGYPDGSKETISGTFDGTNYPYDSFTGPASWGSPSAYKILKVVNNGTNFVVTAL
jgi:hypothetical protein